MGKLEGARDVSLGESHRLFGYILGTLAGGLGLPFERAHGLVRRGNKAVESLPRLLDALFGKRAHFRGVIETSAGGHLRSHLWRVATPARRAPCSNTNVPPAPRDGANV